MRSDKIGGWLDGLRSRGPAICAAEFPSSCALEETGESAAAKPQLLDNLYGRNTDEA
jgi:hypothetical protein